MKELVADLIKLQEYDNRLNTLELQKGDLPTVIEQIGSDLHQKKSRSTELEEQTQKLHKDRKIFEKEIEASKQQLKKYEEQLYHVQNNKEYDALTLEIDTKKMEIESLENKIIQSMEEEERVKSEIEQLGSEVGNLGEQLSTNRDELSEINDYTEAEESRLKRMREELAAKIDTRHLRMYERIRKAKDGLAVAPVKRNSCSGCFSALPPQRIVEIRKADRLYNCEHCGRILVWDETE